MAKEEITLAFRRLSEEVEDLRKIITEKDKLISELNLTIMSLKQEISQRNSIALEQSEEQTSEARKAFL